MLGELINITSNFLLQLVRWLRKETMSLKHLHKNVGQNRTATSGYFRAGQNDYNFVIARLSGEQNGCNLFCTKLKRILKISGGNNFPVGNPVVAGLEQEVNGDQRLNFI